MSTDQPPRWARALAAQGLRWALVAPVLLWSLAAGAQPADDARCLLRQGQVRLATAGLEAAYAQADSGSAKARAAAALGHALLRSSQLARAESLLVEAGSGLVAPREQAAAALDLGHAYLAQRKPEQAGAAWQAAALLAPDDAEVALAAELNLTRLPQAPRRAERLQAASQRLGALPQAAQARHALNIAAQAREAGAVELSLGMAEAGRAAAVSAGDDALAAEAYDTLGALYEQQQRGDEALRLTERGLWHAQRVPMRELLVPLEWRAGRLAQRLGRDDLALAAYRRAVEHIEAVRADIPVQYLDGRSSFRDTLEPVYLGLTDLLLRRSGSTSGSQRTTLLREARDVVELIKQTELEDYLRDRCSVGSVRSARGFVPPAGTAIYYPIILPDRLELLLETADGIERETVPVSGDTLRKTALDFVAALRSRGFYRGLSERLYRWLIGPLEARLAERGITTLVAVPDGVLRLVPLAALHDGRDFVVKRLTLATVPGLSLTSTPRQDSGPLNALLAGMSEPGPVVDKLPSHLVNTVLDLPANAAEPADRSPQAAAERSKARTNALRDALSLPGVKQELENIAQVLGATSLLDERFTLAAFEQQLRSRDYPVVHIASHGVFGDSADNTFIMTFDELLTLDGLQKLLGSDRQRRKPIELITLSACQTAEGDDRAPLGMSGTAIKARARSALGTLWPVNDEAAQRLMSQFYRLLAAGGHSKIGALREAQIALLASPAHQHPFYWAPFILIGDWL